MTYTNTFLVGCVLTTLFLQSNGRAIASYSGSGYDDVSGSASYYGSYEVVGEAPYEVVDYEMNFGSVDEHKNSSGSGNVTGNVTGNGSGNDDDDERNISLVGILLGLAPLMCGGGACILVIVYHIFLDNCLPYYKKLKWKISKKLEERNLPIKNSKLNSKFVKKLNKKNLKQITAKAENTTLECTICIDDINLKDYENKKHSNKIVIPNCGHIYHTNCLNEWVRSQILNGQQPTCPTCRVVICDIPVTKSYTVYNASYDSDIDGYSSGGYWDD